MVSGALRIDPSALATPSGARIDLSGLLTPRVKVEQRPRPKPRVLIATPMSWEFVGKETWDSFDALNIWPGCGRVKNSASGALFALRNEAVSLMQTGGFEGVLFVDADMVFRQDALERITSHGQPIVSGICRQRRRPFRACMYMEFAGGLTPIEPRACVGDLFPVDAVGGAFLYVEAKVFEALEKPYCLQLENRSEDMYFCRKARAAGWPIYVDLKLKIGHRARAIVSTDGKTLEPCILME